MKKENILNLKEVNYPYSPLYDRIQRKNKNEYNHNEEMNTRSNFSTISENSENNLGSKFSQMRNEISLLQNKIESIEKKYGILNLIKVLKEKINLNKTESYNEKYKLRGLNPNSFLIGLNQINHKTKFLTEKSPNINHNYINTYENIESISKINKDYRPSHSENITVTKDNHDGQEIKLMNAEYINIIKNWKDKFYHLSEECENTRKILILEKQKSIEFEKLKCTKENCTKELFELKNQLSGLIEEKDKLIFRNNQSEIIRMEQSKIIQFLNNEIERFSKADNEIKGTTECAEIEKNTNHKNFSKDKKELNKKTKIRLKNKSFNKLKK